MTQVLDFLWGSIQYKDFAFFGLIQRDLWGTIRPGKISGHGLFQYVFQGTIYAKSAMTQVLVILGGFSENCFFGTYQILWMSDFGGLTLVPYGLLGPNGDTKLLIWPIPLIYVKTAMTQDALYYHHSICKIRIGSPYNAWQSLRSFTGSGLEFAFEYIWYHYSLVMFYI